MRPTINFRRVYSYDHVHVVQVVEGMIHKLEVQEAKQQAKRQREAEKEAAKQQRLREKQQRQQEKQR